jgi:hypothetical protein
LAAPASYVLNTLHEAIAIALQKWRQIARISPVPVSPHMRIDNLDLPDWDDMAIPHGLPWKKT